MFAAVEARCVPRLQLKAESLFLADGEIQVAALNLDFAYHGAPRDLAAERRARQVIESLGAVELASLDDAEVMPGARVDYVLRIDGDVHALCAFSAYALPQLRNMGWTIDIDPDYPWQVVDNEAPMYADVSHEDRPDWFSLELGVEVDGHRVNLLPALLAKTPGQFGTDVKVIDFNGMANNCTLTLDSLAPPSGTVTADGMCDNGTNKAGYALAFNAHLVLNRMCATSNDTVPVTLSGTVAVSAMP
jgi:hypothetical protein